MKKTALLSILTVNILFAGPPIERDFGPGISEADISEIEAFQNPEKQKPAHRVKRQKKKRGQRHTGGGDRLVGYLEDFIQDKEIDAKFIEEPSGVDQKFEVVKKLLEYDQDKKLVSESERKRQEEERRRKEIAEAKKKYEREKTAYIQQQKGEEIKSLIPIPVSSMTVGTKTTVYADYLVKTLNDMKVVDYTSLPRLDETLLEHTARAVKNTVSSPSRHKKTNTGVRIPKSNTMAAFDGSASQPSYATNEKELTKYSPGNRYVYKKRRIRLSIGDVFHGWKVTEVSKNYVAYQNIETNQTIRKYY